MGEERWVVKNEVVALVWYRLTVTSGFVEVRSIVVESVKIGVARGILVGWDEVRKGGKGSILIGVEDVFGDGRGEGTKSLTDWFTSGFIVSSSMQTGGSWFVVAFSLRTCSSSSLRMGSSSSLWMGSSFSLRTGWFSSIWTSDLVLESDPSLVHGVRVFLLRAGCFLLFRTEVEDAASAFQF